MAMLRDIAIAQAAEMQAITQIAATLNLAAEDLLYYGPHIAKLSAQAMQ
ncbi:MAG: Formate--tetrahydrofolate ligase, partial [Pseudomonadota bacterium]